MVDSSIGGKTAINLAAEKNRVGAVHQPVAVLCDLQALRTLPDDEYRAAFAKIVKAAMIADAEFVFWLDARADALLARDEGALRQAVRRAAAIKVAVVSEDPHEQGRRSLLNYGHPAGHALETAAGGRLRHGEAVAWGMQVAAAISVAMGWCEPRVRATQEALLRRFELLSPLPAIAAPAVRAAMRLDKKSRDGELRWVLLRGMGEAEWGCPLDAQMVERALQGVRL